MSKAKLFKAELKGTQIAAIRLITGEEVLARVVETTDTYVKLDQPRVLVASLQNRPDGTPFMAANVLNWFNADPDASAKISYDDVVSVTEPENGMQNEYIRFTTGIELSSAGSIIV